MIKIVECANRNKANRFWDATCSGCWFDSLIGKCDAPYLMEEGDRISIRIDWREGSIKYKKLTDSCMLK